jgi:hypothetical protein
MQRALVLICGLTLVSCGGGGAKKPTTGDGSAEGGTGGGQTTGGTGGGGGQTSGGTGGGTVAMEPREGRAER